MAGQAPIFHAQHRSSGMQQRQCLISSSQVEAHADSLITLLALTVLLSFDISSLQTLTARTSSSGPTHTPILVHPSLHFASSARCFGNRLLQAQFLSQACADLHALHFIVNTSYTYIYTLSLPVRDIHQNTTTNLQHTKQSSTWLAWDPRGRLAVRAPWQTSRTT